MKNTVESLKQELIDHLHSIDKSKLSMMELKTYADMVKTIGEIPQSNYLDTLMKTFSNCYAGVAASPAPMKGGE